MPAFAPVERLLSAEEVGFDFELLVECAGSFGVCVGADVKLARAATDDSYRSSLVVGSTGAEAGVNSNRSLDCHSTVTCGRIAANVPETVANPSIYSPVAAEMHHSKFRFFQPLNSQRSTPKIAM